jgi:RHS repeat-associated protein
LTEISGKGYDGFSDDEFYFNDEFLPKDMKLEYDLRGNLVKTTNENKVTGQYTFDATNKLVTAVNNKGEKSTFTYDGFGRRVGMNYDENPSGKKVTELNYLHDVTKPYDNVLMISSNNKDETSKKYTYGLEMLSVDTSKFNGKSNRNYYLHDELGSTIGLVNEKGNAQAEFYYDEFGRPVKSNPLQSIDNKGNVFSFTGYQLDDSTGLMYAQARYYMPEVGRFVSEDSYRGEMPQPQTLNRYVYCAGNPLKFVDPSGNCNLKESDMNSIPEPPSNYNNSQKVQYYLSNMGFDIGGIDGDIGFRSQAAILIFQYSQGVEITGRADNATLMALKQSSHEGKTVNDTSVLSTFIPVNTGLDEGGHSITNRKEPNYSDLIVVGGYQLHKDAAVAWAYLTTAAREDGIGKNLLTVKSGYRSIADQQKLWTPALKKYGSEQAAKRWVAKPGGSEHQTGYAIDFGMSYSLKSENVSKLKNTDEYKWMIANASKYGFYNYIAEPWHWSYNPLK